MKHRSEVIYTTDDDGIWITCVKNDRVHWSVNLGFYPSVDQIAAAWAGHLQEDEE